MFETANYIEAGLWGVVGAIFFALAARSRSGDRAAMLLAGIVFVAFGLSDVVEVQTGAWWRPWWLLAWKAACLLVMGVLLARHVNRRRGRSRPRPAIHTKIMNDGSRWFATLPQTVLWDDVRSHARRLPGAEVTGFVYDGVTEAWIEFRFRDHSFSINDQFGEYWFFVADVDCPDETLMEVADHFAQILR